MRLKQIKYTPDAADKLRDINRSILLQYGEGTAKTVIGSITSAIRGLADYEQRGPSVEKIFGVPSEYRYLLVARNYIFYRIESDCIRIINIYNEKENFMWLLFGGDTTSQETIDYWEEQSGIANLSPSLTFHKQISNISQTDHLYTYLIKQIKAR